MPARPPNAFGSTFSFAPRRCRLFSNAKKATSLPTLGDNLRYSRTKILDFLNAIR